MNLYTMAHAGVRAIKESPFKLEKDMQNTFEANLEVLTNLTLVKSEFTLKGFRFDTLAFDKESSAFIVIEYKRNKSQSIIDQGIAYLNSLLEYRDSLLIEYNEKFHTPLKRKDVDWSQTRIIFVANKFNEYQHKATNFKNIGIELIEFKRYENHTLSLNFIQRSKNAPSLPNDNPKPDEKASISNINREIIEYTENHHLDNKATATVELYESFRDAILNLDENLHIDFKKFYIAYKKDKTNIVDIAIQASGLKLFINAPWGSLDDPKHIFRNMQNIGHHGNGDYQTVVKNTMQLEYIMSVIKQRIMMQKD